MQREDQIWLVAYFCMNSSFYIFKGIKKKSPPKTLTETTCSLRSLKYSPPGPLQKKFADPGLVC